VRCTFAIPRTIDALDMAVIGVLHILLILLVLYLSAPGS
jgi:hypothetical protein